MWTAGSDSYYYPPLSDVFETFGETWLFERVGSDVVPSLVRLSIGYFDRRRGRRRGSASRSACRPSLRRIASPIVEFLRAIPAPALLPFALLVLGVGNTSKIFVIAFVCLWPVLLNAIDGVSGVDPTLTDTGRVYRICAPTACATSCCPPPRRRSSPACARACRWR